MENVSPRTVLLSVCVLAGVLIGLTGTSVIASPISSQQTTDTIDITVNDSKNGNATATAPVTISGQGPGSAPGDVSNNGKAAVDTDGDGKYENVNGDKRVNINDVQALFAARNAGRISAGDTAFDFNNDTTVNINDVQALFTEV